MFAGLSNTFIYFLEYFSSNRIRSSWIKLIQIGSNQIKVDLMRLIGPNWIKLDQIRTNQFKSDQIGSKETKLDQVG